MLKKIIRKLFVASFLLVVVAFLAASLSPFLNPAQWWFFGFLGLIFPYILTLLLLFGLYWVIKRSRWALLVVLCIAVSWKSIRAAFALNLRHDFEMQKAPGALRVMTWNVRYFISPDEKIIRSGISEDHQKIFDLIGTYNPDILTMQEFITADSGLYANNVKIIETELGFKYHFFLPMGDKSAARRKRPERRGIIIFSKYPIVHREEVDLPLGLGTTEAVIFADIAVNQDTIRVFAGHMQSFGFMRQDYENIHKIKTDADERLDASKSVARKMRRAFQYRGKQADRILEVMEDSKYPEIFCADLNDVPNSYTYFTIKGNKKDAFIEKGWGFGKTYYSFHSGFMRRLPALRIDFILADPQFTILQAKPVKQILSDHIPVVTDISLGTD